MLDVALRNLVFRHRAGFTLRDITLTFTRSTHTAIAGAPSCGASTLLELITGTLRPESGEVVIGQRRVNDLKPARRPLLHVTSSIGVPPRWTVQHALVAAVRGRSLDREDRHREYELAAGKWRLEPLLERRIASLSSTEIARTHFARLELLRPAILLADRLLEGIAPAERQTAAEELYRTLRVHGTTVISAPSSRFELAFTDSVVILDEGRVVQTGSAAEVFANPLTDAAAAATGEFNVIPVTVRGSRVSSVIGEWEVESPKFQGGGIALARPQDFLSAEKGEESDLIFGVEEAGFADGVWIARGILSGGVALRVALPRESDVHKGRLIALRYDPARFRLLPREMAPLDTSSIPRDAVPAMSETR